MVGQQSSPQSEETTQENQQDQSPPTFEDKLADKVQKEGGFAEQNQVTSQLGIAALFRFAIEGLSVKNARDLLRGEIDINKLVTDPKYKSEVERAVQLVNRYDFIAKKGDLIEKVPRVEKALVKVSSAHRQLQANKELHLKLSYGRNIQTIYNLSDEEFAMVKGGALLRIQKDPTLSIENALLQESRDVLRKRDIKEAKEQLKKRGEPTDDKSVIKKAAEIRLDREKKFKEASATPHEYESRKNKQILNNCNNEVVAILSTPTAPSPTPQTIPATPPPATSTPPPVPPPTSAWPTISSIPIPGGYSLRNVPLPSFGGIKNGLGIMGNAIGNSGNFFRKSLGFLGKKGLGRFTSLAGNLGKQAINRALDAFLPGLGMTVGKINDVIKSITGIDIEKTILVGAALLVGAVASVIIIVPIIIGVGVISSITGDKPMIINTTNKKLGWNEFNNQYLTTNNKTLSLDFSPSVRNDKNITWQQFEKDYLILQKQLLSSLDANRHDDVKK